MAALSRWNVPVDDSGGDALADTPLGVFARLVAEAALDGLAPVKLLAHAQASAVPERTRWAVAALERAILRGPRPKAGTEGLRLALGRFREELDRLRRRSSELHRSDPRTEMKDAELDAAEALVAQLKDALAPLETLGATPRAVRRDRAAASRGDGRAARSRPGDATETRELDAIFDTILQGGRIAVRPGDYAEMFQAALADGGVVRPREQDVRVRIYGPLEARLQNVDRMVLGGLTEGMWPPETRADPWLSRPMRQDARPRPAGAAHRPVGARFRAGAGREGDRADPRGAGGGRADGGLALRAAARGGGGRGSDGMQRSRAARNISPGRARSTDRTDGRSPIDAPGADAAARGAAQVAVGDRDRDAAARSVFDLCASTCCGCARSTRSTRRSARATAAP